MAKTLARVLEVPFSMSDCTPLTQAGYIGEDVEVVVQRLLAAANYDVARAEHGIICLDEIDKIATAKVSHGKDVSGEGVQQALLKIIEGTTVQIQAKQERGATPGGRQQGTGVNMPPNGFPHHSPLGSGGTGPPPGGGPGSPGASGKNEVFNIRTDNILFICTGAFIGLHKTILDRISKGSIGFGANVRASAHDSQNPHNTTLKTSEHADLVKNHMPFFTPGAAPGLESEQTFNTLDLVEPSDLQKYGMIPELVGRIPISCALSSLDEEALVRVLTEPRNALLKQYEQLFSLSGIELGFTSPALRVVASEASKMGTGARGLKTVLERLLGDAMFECPGSGTKFVLVTENVAKRKQPPVYLGRGDGHTFHSIFGDEEKEWNAKQAEKRGEKPPGEGDPGENEDGIHDFREYRQSLAASGL
jgi:ATP-dependent Clp protease ATP-binding subunit ClpX